MDVSISEGGRSNICRRTRKFVYDATRFTHNTSFFLHERGSVPQC